LTANPGLRESQSAWNLYLSSQIQRSPTTNPDALTDKIAAQFPAAR
jgi:hypothetical protein